MTTDSTVRDERGTRFPTRVVADRQEAAARARQLAPLLAARAEDTNARRQIPDETMADLHEAGLFSLLTPPRFGGSGLGPDAVFVAAVELARACGSTGWTYGVLSGHAGLIAGFPEETQAEVFANPDTIVASLLRLGSEPLERVDGGYRLTAATGRFCSGVDHCDWIIARCQVAGEGDGLRWFLLPRASFDIVDDWYTVGLQGTGSKSLTVRPTFIPDHHSMAVAPTTGAGALSLGAPFSLCGAAIGCAYAAVDAFRNSLAKKGSGGVREANLLLLAKASAEVDAAYLMVLDARSEQLGDHAWTPLRSNRAKRNIAYSVAQARSVVNDLFAASGGSAIYSNATMQQIWRDANAASAHGYLSWDDNAFAFAQQFAFGD